MDLSTEITVLRVRGDKSNKAYLATHCKKFSHLRNTADVLCSVFSSETEVFIKSSSDNVTVENETFPRVSQHSVKLVLNSN